ncbi:MAG: UDP-glucose 4-epimerase GalE [Coriobacteriales bacterium]
MAGRILVTGGTGFIGSHTCVELIERGYDVVVIDNLSNSKEEPLNRIERITGTRPGFFQVDIRDREALDEMFEAAGPFDAVIHFAGLKAVGESVEKPLEYYGNNIAGTVTLCESMRAHGCTSIIFSSSATVYGENPIPYVETMQKLAPASPYGWTKWMIEQVLMDLAASDPAWNVVLLRYFNPIGAHPSGLMGEDPKGIPNNLLPYVAQVAIGKRECIHVFGGDYDTNDGTCERDYIHVMDLASGHVAALDWMMGRSGVEVFNLGTGRGTSVLQIVAAFSKACGRELPYVMDQRREGDLPAYWADATKAREMLGWEARYGIAEMCADGWRWQSNNPDGYGE